MQKRVRIQRRWLALLQGVLIGLGTYLAGILLLTALVLSGAVREELSFSAIAILCVISSFIGYVMGTYRITDGEYSMAMLTSGVIALIQILVGSCLPGGIGWAGEGGGLLCCTICGGVLAGAFKRKKRRRTKKRHG